jgi:CheY-like chemotaxis protein
MITVLYVENEENDVLFMRRAFKREGLEGCLRIVATGREAMSYLTGEASHADRELYPFPVLLLLDLNLPAISGFEMLSWLRQQPQSHLRELPVVIFSSSARVEDRMRAQELGASDYLQKPTSGAQFLQVVQELKRKWLAPPPPQDAV